MPLNKDYDGVSPKMLTALEHAWSLQNSGKDFSLKDLNGSKSGLINRELIEISTFYKAKKEIHSWRVTKKGKSVLKFHNIIER
ncbi:MAG: hypothetical protein NVSMB45_13300 [Ginsengibacter sp.]